MASLPFPKEVREVIKKHVGSIRVNPFRIKTSFTMEGEFTFDASDILSLKALTQWQEIGTETFKLLRKYNRLNFVIFLDEMGWVRKAEEDEKTLLEFLNFLHRELTEEGTPVFVLCGSQNFFHILQDIKPEIYQLWKRQFWRVTVGCFEHDASVNKLLIPNFKEQDSLAEPFFTDEIIKGISEFIYKVSSGYPSIMQILGKEISFLIGYYKKTGRPMNMDTLKEIVINRAFWECIVHDKQSLCHELLSEEALGTHHNEYRRLIYQLYNNPSNAIDRLDTGYDQYHLDDMLKDIEDLQYIILNGNKYNISYAFLKYNLWHPKSDNKINKEINDLWKSVMSTTP